MIDDGLNFICPEEWPFPYTRYDLPLAITRHKTLHFIDNTLILSKSGKITKRGIFAAEYVFNRMRERVVENNEEFTYSNENGTFRLYRYGTLHSQGIQAQIAYN